MTMRNYLKDLQEEIITSEISCVGNVYTFEVTNLGTVVVEDNGMAVYVKVSIDGEDRNYPISPAQAFDLLPTLAFGLETELEYEDDSPEIEDDYCVTIFEKEKTFYS